MLGRDARDLVAPEAAARAEGEGDPLFSGFGGFEQLIDF